MKKIPLKNDLFALVDDEDFDLINSYKWNVEAHGQTYRAVRKNCKTYNEEWFSKNAKMHRFLLKAKKGQIIDHIDGNALNNQKSNLRFCTHQENARNSPSRLGSSSKYVGVTWDKKVNKWRSQIVENKKVFHLGTYEKEFEAALVYNVAASFLFKGFGRLNAL